MSEPLLVQLSTVKPERVDWLWPGYLARGKLHILDGDPGLGKSSLSTDLAARLTTGKPWPDGQPGGPPGGVLLLSAEDGLADTIRPRLDAAGADVGRVFAFTAVRSWDEEADEVYDRLPQLPGDLVRLEEALGRFDVDLVIVDPLMAYLGESVNSHRDQDVRRALTPLTRAAEENGVAVILIRHLSKAGGANAVYRGGGSIGIIGQARLGFTVARDPADENRVIVACSKANITAKPPSLAYRLVNDEEHGCARVEWEDGPVAYTADDLMASSMESADDRRDREDAAKWLFSYLADNGGEADAIDVLKAGEKVGFSKDALKRAKRRAGVVSVKEAFDAGWMWRVDLPRAHEESEGRRAQNPAPLPPFAPLALSSDDNTGSGALAPVTQTVGSKV